MTTAGLRKSLEWLLCVALAPALVAVAILALPLVLLSQAWDFARLWWYCWRRGAWDFLVCSPRGGWHQFIENNLARALPGGLTLVWTTEGQSPRSPLRMLFGGGRAIQAVPRPRRLAARYDPFVAQSAPNLQGTIAS